MIVTQWNACLGNKWCQCAVGCRRALRRKTELLLDMSELRTDDEVPATSVALLRRGPRALDTRSE